MVQFSVQHSFNALDAWPDEGNESDSNQNVKGSDRVINRSTPVGFKSSLESGVAIPINLQGVQLIG